jgi:hypothetical protein
LKQAYILDPSHIHGLILHILIEGRPSTFLRDCTLWRRFLRNLRDWSQIVILNFLKHSIRVDLRCRLVIELLIECCVEVLTTRLDRHTLEDLSSRILQGHVISNASSSICWGSSGVFRAFTFSSLIKFWDNLYRTLEQLSNPALLLWWLLFLSRLNGFTRTG